MTGPAGSMKIDCLGHVALNVRDLSRSEAFYAGVLGLPVSGRMGDDMVFFRLSPDRFQDLALAHVGDEQQLGRVGLDHVAFRVGSSLADLRAAQEQLHALGIAVTGPVDHTWSASVYLSDPDGNGIELYVDQSDVWRSDPQFVPTAKPFDSTHVGSSGPR